MRAALGVSLLLGCGTSPPSGQATPHALEVERGEVLCVALDTERVLAGASNDHLRSWRLPGGAPTADVRGHRRGITCIALEGARVVTGGPDRTVRLWSAESLEETRVLRGLARPPIALAFTPDGRIVAASMGGELFAWDAASGGLRLDRPGPAQRGVMAAALSADGTRMVWAADGGNLRVWDTASGERVGALRVDDLGFVSAVAIARDGRVATAARDTPRVALWDLAREQLAVECAGVAGTPRALAFAPDGVRLAVSTTAGDVQLFDARTGGELRRWSFGGGEVRRLAFDREGARLAAAGPGARLHWIEVTAVAAPSEVVVGPPLDAPILRRDDARPHPTSGRIGLAQLALPAYDPPELRATPRAMTLQEFPARVRDLDGERITVVGHPLATGDGGRFLLARFPPGCCSGSVPVPDEWIEVTLGAPGSFGAPEQTVEVTGVLEVGEVLDELGFVESLYRMQAESVRR